MKYLVVLLNNTNTKIKFVNRENEGDNQTVGPNEAFRTDVHFSIPDNSESSRYFDEHHMEIQTFNNGKDEKDGTETLYSFWADDNDDYKLKFCNGINHNNIQSLPGYSEGGNHATVGIMLNADTTLSAFKVINDV